MLGICNNLPLTINCPYQCFAHFGHTDECLIIIAIVLGVVEGILGSHGIIGMLYSLALLIPGIAVSVRRLHDTERSGWWLLIAFVPIIGAIVLLVFMVQDSKSGQNQYGTNPKEATA
ncbi:MAG: DUF805 domain-containing protein [Deltaproteobacteria bacterium]|nr:DUF805 domain-containing protein [Deltaproteobacteria bacterium]